MIFTALYESAERGELILVDGGICNWHLRRDGQITIREIISIQKGAGSKMLGILKEKNASSIFAKCPIGLPANEWYKKQGFVCEGEEVTPSGSVLKLWRLKNKKG